MSTDRELLEAAAKAAGIKVVRSRLEDPGNKDMLIVESVRNPSQQYGPWNPLTDDGDALRLAVKLEIDLTRFEGHDIRATLRIPTHGTPGEHLSVHQPVDGDPYAATRRAIVRAAASLATKEAP